jgi:CP family cyanate transporter-like MFS transporter
MPAPKSAPPSSLDPTGVRLGLVVTWFVAVNLRAGLIGMGPLIPALEDDIGISAFQGGLLIAVPTAMMGVVALLGGRVADRWGARRDVILALCVLAGSGIARAFSPNFFVLLALTALFGAGIGLAQPAMPRLARGLVGKKVGLATGIYAGGFFTGSVAAAFLTGAVLLPLFDDNWRGPLMVWGGMATVALVIWLLSLRFWSSPASDALPAAPVDPAASSATTRAHDAWSPWRDRAIWITSWLFLGQGLFYYLLAAWLPSVYEDLGMDRGHASLLFAIFNLATFPAMVGLPALSDRTGSRRPAMLLAAVMTLAGGLGLALAPDAAGLDIVWVILGGAGSSGIFGLTLVLPTDYAPPSRTGVAAGMMLMIGYLGSATGPLIGGVVRDLTGSFSGALLVLPVISVTLVAGALILPHRREFPATT